MLSLARGCEGGHDLRVPFFDPLPEPIPEPEAQIEQSWSPPLWDRPSQGTLPAVVGPALLFARAENVALALDHVRVYPNGFQLVTAILTSPHLPPELQMGGLHTISLLAARKNSDENDEKEPPKPAPVPSLRRHLFMDGPRIGVQFANGQRAGVRPESPFEVPKDEAGIPTEPIITGAGGGGGGGYFRWDHWVFPLPSPGPLTVFAEWTAAGIEETSLVLSGDDIRDAAHRAIVLWS
jgi:hypothetical protein